MAETIYDVVIIGSGPAGYTAAIRGAEYGLKVALIEKSDKLGGTCLHVGCIPTKAILFNAEIWDHLKHAADYGIDGVTAPVLNWQTVLKRKNGIVAKHAKGLEFLMRKNKVTTIEGYGRLTGPAKDGVHTVEVYTEGGGGAAGETSQVKGKNVILATGSEARTIFGLEPDSRILTNVEILAINQVPKSLIVIGAGAVGVEFSSIFRSFGSEVTIVEFLPRAVPVEDEEISKELTRVFKKRGIDMNTGSKVEKIEKTEAGVKVTWTDSNGKTQVKEAEKVLVAVGRAPRTDNINLDRIKAEVERGFIKVNEAQETAEPGVFAIGDIVAGLPQLAPCGRDERDCGDVEDCRPRLQAGAPRPHSGLHVYRAADRFGGADGGAGQGEGLHRQGGQIPVRGQLQGDDCGQPRRLREDRVGREVWGDSGRSHHRAAGDGTDCRGGGGDGVGGHGGGDDVHDPRASDAVGSDAGWLRRGGRHGDQRLRERRRRRLPTPIMR